MPLLPLEPFLFPEDVLTQPPPAEEEDGQWWVLHTRPRAEKTLARRLLEGRQPFFLPLYQRKWHNNGRSFQSWLPLFPGYVFLHGSGQARLKALQTNLLANVLPVLDQEQLQADLRRVHALIVSGLPLLPEERLEPGTAVEIVRGPLAGLEGKVLRQGKNWKFFVEVKLLQRGVSVEIDAAMIRPVATARPAPLTTTVCG
jgi:transcription antitermination factor NusG